MKVLDFFVCFVVPLRDQEREAISRDTALQCARAYDFEAFHEFVLTAYGWDCALVKHISPRCCKVKSHGECLSGYWGIHHPDASESRRFARLC